MSSLSRLPLAGSLILLTLPACHRVGSGFGIDFPAADLEAGAVYYDTDRNGELGAGDQIIVFLPDLPQGLTAEEVLADIELPVLRDSLGEEPTAELEGGRLRITLGPGARLKSRQQFDTQAIIENSASGIEYTGDPALVADIVPGFVSQNLGGESGATHVHAIDYNADGFPDLVTSDGLELRLSLGNFFGFLAGDTFSFPASGQIYGLKVADLNHDGRDDVLQLTSSGLRVWLRTDEGLEASEGLYGTDVRDAFVFDSNLDGSLDIAIADSVADSILLGDGGGGFTPSGAGTTGITRAVVGGDFDGDGDVDLVKAVNQDGTERLLLLTRTDNGFEGPTELLSGLEITRLVAADLDTTGTLDLALALGGGDGALRVLYGEGSGTFQERQHTSAIQLLETELGTGPALGIEAADLDSDGRIDLAVASATGVRLYMSVGATLRECPGEVRAVTSGLTSLDFDRDGDLDLVTTSDVRTTLHYGSLSATWGLVRFEDAQDLSNLITHSLAAGDVNRDGDIELFTGNNLELERYVRSDISGDYELAASINLPQTRVQDLELFDIDRDGDLDVLAALETFGAGASGLWIAFQDATGEFVEAPQPVAYVNPASSLSLGDFNSDGNTDVALGGMNGQADQLLINLGYQSGEWQGFDQPIGLGDIQFIHTSDLRFLDVDRDGDLDLLTAHIPGEANRLWIQDAGGMFQEQLLPDSVGLDTRSITMGDLDLDGDLDLVTGNAIGERVWLRSGENFFLFPGDLANSDTFELTLAHIDGDAFLDLVIANRGSDLQEGVQVWLNRGVDFNQEGGGIWLGFGQDPEGRPDFVLRRGAVDSVLADDIDRDGDVDILSGSTSNDAATGVWRNL